MISHVIMYLFFHEKQVGEIRFQNNYPAGHNSVRRDECVDCETCLSNHGPVHVDAAAEFDPLRRVAGVVVAEHAGGILADQQIVFSVAVVIARADHEPVFCIELTDGPRILSTWHRLWSVNG